jgi:hypothetical protein
MILEFVTHELESYLCSSLHMMLNIAILNGDCHREPLRHIDRGCEFFLKNFWNLASNSQLFQEELTCGQCVKITELWMNTCTVLVLFPTTGIQPRLMLTHQPTLTLFLFSVVTLVTAILLPAPLLQCHSPIVLLPSALRGSLYFSLIRLRFLVLILQTFCFYD